MLSDNEIEIKRLFYKIQSKNKVLLASNNTLLVLAYFFSQGLSQSQLKRRGIRFFTGLAKYFHTMDENGDGKLNRFCLEKALIEFKLELPMDVRNKILFSFFILLRIYVIDFFFLFLTLSCVISYKMISGKY